MGVTKPVPETISSLDLLRNYTKLRDEKASVYFASSGYNRDELRWNSVINKTNLRVVSSLPLTTKKPFLSIKCIVQQM